MSALLEVAVLYALGLLSSGATDWSQISPVEKAAILKHSRAPLALEFRAFLSDYQGHWLILVFIFVNTCGLAFPHR